MSRQEQTGQTCETRWLTALADIDAAAPLWRSLDERSTAGMVWFQSFEWCRHWIDNHAARNLTPRVLMLVRDGKAIAILPMMRRRVRFGVNVLEILGAPHTQYANVLTESGTLTPAEIALLRKALAAEGGGDTAIFPLVPEGSALAQLLGREGLSAAMENESAQFEFASLPAGQEFEGTLSKDRQRDLRRCARNLEQGGALQFDILRPGMARYRDAVAACMAMKEQWLTETAKLGRSFMYDGHQRFLASMAQAANGTDGPYVWMLSSGGRPVAVEIGFLQRGHYYAYMGGFDWSLRKHSPGKIQMGKTLNALAAMGADSYDLLANPTDYKKDYSTRHLRLSGHVVNLTSRGAVYTRLWTQMLLPLARHVFYSLPSGLRHALSVLRKSGLRAGA